MGTPCHSPLIDAREHRGHARAHDCRERAFSAHPPSLSLLPRTEVVSFLFHSRIRAARGAGPRATRARESARLMFMIICPRVDDGNSEQVTGVSEVLAVFGASFYGCRSRFVRATGVNILRIPPCREPETGTDLQAERGGRAGSGLFTGWTCAFTPRVLSQASCVMFWLSGRLVVP